MSSGSERKPSKSAESSSRPTDPKKSVSGKAPAEVAAAPVPRPKGTFWDSNVLLVGDPLSHLGTLAGVAQLPISQLLIPLQKRSTIYARRQCAYSFATYASPVSPIENAWEQIIMMDDHAGFRAIVALVRDRDPVCQRFGALAMQLLAMRPEALPHLAKVNALEYVLPRALILDGGRKDWDADAQRYCIIASENMSLDVDRHRFVMGFLNEIVHMIERPPHPSYRASAIGICRNLALSPRFRPNLLPAVRACVAILKTQTQTIECRTKAADFLALVSDSDVAKAYLLSRRIFTIVVNVVEACTGDPEESRMLGNIALMLQNFALVVEAHRGMLDDDTLLTIMVLGSMTHVADCLIGITRVLQILSSYPARITLLVNLKGIEIVLQAFFLCDHIECRLAALGFVANLVHYPRYHDRLVLNRAPEAIAIGLQNSHHDCLAPSIKAAAYITREVRHQAAFSPGAIIPIVFRVLVDTKRASLETRDHALVTLANLAADPGNHPVLLGQFRKHEAAILTLTTTATLDDTLVYLGKFLCNLLTTEDREIRAFIGRPAVLSQIAKLFATVNVNVVKCGLAVLAGLLRDDDDVRVAVTRACYGGLRFVARLWCSETYHYMVAMILSNLTRSRAVVETYPWQDWLDLAEHLLAEPWAKVSRKGMEFLLNIADLNAVQEAALKTTLINRMFTSVVKQDHSFPLALHVLAKFSAGILPLRLKVAERNCIGVFARLLLSRCKHWRKYALLCIGNFTSMEETPLPLTRVNLIKHMVDLADDKDADLEETRFCTYALANMSYHECNRQDLLNSASFLFRKLAVVIESGDLMILRGLAQFLLNMCFHLRHTHMFGSNLVVQTILRIARFLDTTTKVFAIQALHCLAEVPRNGRAFIEGGVVQFLKDEGLDYKRRDASATRQLCQFMSYACLIDDVASACSQQDLVPTLLYLTTHPEESVQLDVLKVMVSMAKNPAAQAGLVSHAMVDLVTLLECDHPDKRLMAALAIGHVICRLDAQRLIAQACRDSIYKDLLCSPFPEVSLVAVWIMAHLIHERDDHNDGAAGNDFAFDDPELVASRAASVLTNEERERNRVLAVNVMGQLADLALNSEATPALAKYATLAVVRFSSAPHLHNVLKASCAKVVEQMFEIASSEDAEMRPVMVTMLANLSTNRENHAFLEKHVDVSRLDLMVGGDDLETQTVAISAVSGLAMTPGNAQQMVDGARILPIMSTMCKSDDKMQLQSIAAVFVNLSEHPGCRVGMLDQQVIQGIISLLQSNETKTQYNACRALSNLLNVPDAIIQLRDMDHTLVSNTLWGVVPSKSPSVVGVALRVLCFLGGRDDFYFLMNNDDGIACLVGVARNTARRDHDRDDCEYHSAVVLRACCEMPRLLPMLVRKGIVDTLLGFCRAAPRTSPVHLLGVTGLEDVARFPDGKKSCLEAGDYFRDTLIALIDEGNVALLRHVLAIVLRMSDTPEWNVAFGVDGWSRVLACFVHDDDSIVRLAVRVIASYSRHVSCFEFLTHPDSVAVIRSLLVGRVPALDRTSLSLVGTIANLSRHSATNASVHIDLRRLGLADIMEHVLWDLDLDASDALRCAMMAEALIALTHLEEDGSRAILFSHPDALDRLTQLATTSSDIRLLLCKALDVLSQSQGNFPFLTPDTSSAAASLAPLFGMADVTDLPFQWSCLKTIHNIVSAGLDADLMRSSSLSDAQIGQLIGIVRWQCPESRSARTLRDAIQCRHGAMAIIRQLSCSMSLVEAPVAMFRMLLDVVADDDPYAFFPILARGHPAPADVWPVDPDWSHWVNLVAHGVNTDSLKNPWNDVPAPVDPPDLPEQCRLHFDPQLRLDAINALANLSLSSRTHRTLLDAGAIVILQSFIHATSHLPNCQRLVTGVLHQGTQCLANVVQSMTDEMIEAHEFDFAGLGDALTLLQSQERRCKKGTPAFVLRRDTTRTLLLAMARLSSHRTFRLDERDREFVSAGALIPLLKNEDQATVHFAFLTLVNAIVKSSALHVDMHRERYVEHLMRFLRDRDPVVQWLSLFAIAELFDQSSIGADQIIEHSLLTVVISLAFSDHLQTRRCVARILRGLIAQCGTAAIRHLISSMLGPIGHLSACEDLETALNGARALALLLQRNETLNTMMVGDEDGFGKILAMLDHPCPELRHEAVQCTAMVAEAVRFAPVVMERGAVAKICALVDTLADNVNYEGAALLFRNLCDLPKLTRELSRMGAIESLLRCSAPSRPACQRLVLQAINNFLTHAERYLLDGKWPAIVARIVQPLLQGAATADDIVEQTLKTLVRLCNTKDDCVAYTASAGAVPFLIDVEHRYHAAPGTVSDAAGRSARRLLLFMAEQEPSQVEFCRGGGLSLILRLLSSDVALMRKKASNACASLSLNGAVQDALIDAGCFHQLTAVRTDPCFPVRRKGMEAFLNMLQHGAVLERAVDDDEIVHSVFLMSKGGISKESKDRAAVVYAQLLQMRDRARQHRKSAPKRLPTEPTGESVH